MENHYIPVTFINGMALMPGYAFKMWYSISIRFYFISIQITSRKFNSTNAKALIWSILTMDMIIFKVVFHWNYDNINSQQCFSIKYFLNKQRKFSMGLNIYHCHAIIIASKHYRYKGYPFTLSRCFWKVYESITQ